MLRHGRASTVLTALMYLVLYAMVGLLIFTAVRYRQTGPIRSHIARITSVSASVDGGPWQTVTLPHKFENLAPRTPVSIRTEICPEYDDCVYLKTVYAPAELFLDGKLACALGQEGCYPAYFTDPPAEIRLVDAHGKGAPMALRLQYLSPVSRNALVVPPMMVGSSKEIIFDFAGTLGAPMVLSLVQIISGCMMLLVSLCLMLIDSKGQVFFWLGLFSKFSGIWSLCENDFSILCFKNDSLLYILSFVGLFSFMVPLLRFIRTAVSFRDSRPITILEVFAAAAAVTAMVLQFTGLVPFTRSLFFFHAAIPILLLLSTILVARENLRFHNPYAARFLLPIGILTLSAILAVVNYHMHITYVFSFALQAGVFVFLLLISIFAGLSVKDSIDLKKKAALLEKEKNILDIQTEEQRDWSLLLVQKEQEMSRQRHDLRHHLSAIQDLSADNLPLQEYLATLMEKIPRGKERYCENLVVDSIVSHYAARCEQEGITLTSRLIVPQTRSQTTDSDLCVIFSNLLENAVEACCRMETGEKYIHLSSRMQQNLLSVAMDNSFNGHVTKIGGRFLSSKRNDYGIGLSSVQSIVENAGGDADFHAEGCKFVSSVFLSLPD